MLSVKVPAFRLNPNNDSAVLLWTFVLAESEVRVRSEFHAICLASMRFCFSLRTDPDQIVFFLKNFHTRVKRSCLFQVAMAAKSWPGRHGRPKLVPRSAQPNGASRLQKLWAGFDWRYSLTEVCCRGEETEVSYVDAGSPETPQNPSDLSRRAAG